MLAMGVRVRLLMPRSRGRVMKRSRYPSLALHPQLPSFCDSRFLLGTQVILFFARSLYSVLQFVLDTLPFTPKMLSSIFYTAVVITSAAAHGVILAAQGQAGSPASIGFQGGLPS